VSADVSFPAPGEWPCYRGDGTLAAHSRLRGQIRSPRVAWRHFAGAIETLLEIQRGDGNATLLVPSPVAQRAPLFWAARAGLGEGVQRGEGAADPRWGLRPPPVQIAGQSVSLTRDACATLAHVLPGTTGPQKIEFESAFSKPPTGDAAPKCVGRCYAWQDGAWVQVWQTEEISLLYQPLPLVGDFDADGAPEVTVLPWQELLVFDARTGTLKDSCPFTEGRSYGFFGAYDLDRDGRTEFIVQADFAKHVDVLGYRAGKLSVLWQRQIELDISNPQKVLRVGPDPVADVDGDGRLEVTVNLFNDAGDGRWHVTVHDGMTGEVLADLPDHHLNGLADIDGDGRAELLTTRTEGGGIPEYGTIAAYRVRNRRVELLWQRTGAAWGTWEPALPDHVNSAATLGRRSALARSTAGGTRVVLREPAAGAPGYDTLSVAAWDGARLREETSVSGRGLRELALDPDGHLLARCRTRPGETARVTVRGGQSRALSSSEIGIPIGSVAVVRPVATVSVRRVPAEHAERKPGQFPVAVEAGGAPQPANMPLVLVQGEGEELVAFAAPAASGRSPRELWRRPGRGQGASFPGQVYGPVLGDLAGDGNRQLLYATASPSGCARLVAADLDCRELWHHDFSQLPGAAPVWNTGGIILWQTGRFTHPARQDVLVTIRRSMMHSEETLLLSGVDGRAIWHRDRQLTNRGPDGELWSRGVGGTPFAIADFDSDGLDDAASMHPSLFYVLKGSTGADLVAMEARWDAIPTHLVFFCQPIAGDWLREGTPSILVAGASGALTAVLRPDGALAWWDALQSGPRCLPASGDFCGDGLPAIIGIGYWVGDDPERQEIRCYAAATGEIRWRMPLPAAGIPTGTASADVNGDGRDEALFVIDRTLYCVGTDADAAGAGCLLWQIELPARLGPPALADTAGDGRLSILLTGEDGYVYCVE